MRITRLIVLAVCGFGLLGLSATARGPQARSLSPKDRQFVDSMLGRGVVGEALPAEAVPTREFPLQWLDRDGVRRIVHGKRTGQDVEASLRRLDRPGAVTGFRLDTGGKTVLYGQIETDGSVNQYAADDRKEGVLTQYDPPVPVFRPNMRPGDIFQEDCVISVFDLTNPGKQKHSGRLRVTMEYVGNYRVTVPAGVFDTAAVKWTYKGKVGPASVEDQSYWFFDNQAGPVAWINKSDVSAFLVYKDNTKRASVLVSSGPAGE